EAEFLHAAGCEVVHAVGHALAGSDAYCAAPPAFWRDSTLQAARHEADAYLVSCANIAAMSVIDELEQRLAAPVITSHPAGVWARLPGGAFRRGRRGGCPKAYPAAAGSPQMKVADYASLIRPTIVLAALACAPAAAQEDIATFYKGKTVRIVVGTAAGGGYD